MKQLRKIIVVPDAFKGGMSSAIFCRVAEEAIHRIVPQAQVVSIPIADGGEGTVDAFLAAVGGKKETVTVKGPLFEDMSSFYGILTDGTAVVEMAACAGLPLVKGREDPLRSTTYGVGQLLRHAEESGCGNVILGLGGSATNDAGCGMACALGARFYDRRGSAFIPTGGTLSEIGRIDTGNLKFGLPVTVMCDVNNPLYGPRGAAFVFAPQKGADEEAVRKLDNGLRSFASVVKKDLGIDLETLKGGGAAGGLGAGAVCFLNGTLKMGIETVLDAIRFDEGLTDADLVITGEGKLDSQSLGGKAVLGVARRAKSKDVPVIAVVGDIDDAVEEAYDLGLSGIFSINRVAVPFEQAVLRSQQDLALTVENIMRFIKRLLSTDEEDRYWD
jgi:glycerate kinase